MTDKDPVQGALTRAKRYRDNYSSKLSLGRLGCGYAGVRGHIDRDVLATEVLRLRTAEQLLYTTVKDFEVEAWAQNSEIAKLRDMYEHPCVKCTAWCSNEDRYCRSCWQKMFRPA